MKKLQQRTAKKRLAKLW